MLNKRMLGAAVFVFVSAGVASAQTKPQAPVTSDASISVGYRGSNITGDEARYERYRDLSAGPVVGANLFNETGKAQLTFSAFNVGYNDQAYQLNYNNFGKLKFNAMFNMIPLNYAYYSKTPFVNAGDNRWTLDPTIRTQVQNKTLPAGYIGIGTTAADFTKPSIYNTIAKDFDMSSRRDIIDLGLNYAFSKAINLDLSYNSQKRTGNMPWAAGMAFNNVAELPLALDDRNTDITAALEWAKPSVGSLRVQWQNQNFKNQYTALTWDSPLRATDFDNGKLPPNGPFDPSGYSNGNGPAIGAMSLAPSTKANTFSAVGLYKLPSRTTLTGSVAYTKSTNDQALLPWTTNGKINSAIVLAAYPGLAKAPVNPGMEIEALNAQVAFVTRPSQNVSFDVKYRFNERQNQTPLFDYTYNVRFDAVPEYTPGETTVPYNFRRNTLTTGANVTLPANSGVRFEYIVDGINREHRSFGNITDYTFRVAYDTYKSDLLTIRAVAEKTSRVGAGFSEEYIEETGSQPGTAFYDEADMARKKGTLNLTLTPTAKFDVGASLSKGKDEFNGVEHEFGLMDNANDSYNFNVNLYPTKKVTLSAAYGYDKYTSLQTARNANPFSGVANAYESWNDANRDWDLDGDEVVKTISASADMKQLVLGTNVTFSFDNSKSNNEYLFSGPRIQELITNKALTAGDAAPCATGQTTCFAQWEPVTNNWKRFDVQLSRDISKRFGFNAGYRFEKFDVKDFATLDNADGSPRIDPLGAITTGYGNRSYKASEFTFGFSYMFKATPFIF